MDPSQYRRERPDFASQRRRERARAESSSRWGSAPVAPLVRRWPAAASGKPGTGTRSSEIIIVRCEAMEKAEEHESGCPLTARRGLSTKDTKEHEVFCSYS